MKYKGMHNIDYNANGYDDDETERSNFERKGRIRHGSFILDTKKKKKGKDRPVPMHKQFQVD